MVNTQFTKAELEYTEVAWHRHKLAMCPDDCGFCFDLLLSDLPEHKAEHARIQKAKLPKKPESPPAVKPVMRKPSKQKRPLAAFVRR